MHTEAFPVPCFPMYQLALPALQVLLHLFREVSHEGEHSVSQAVAFMKGNLRTWLAATLAAAAVCAQINLQPTKAPTVTGQTDAPSKAPTIQPSKAPTIIGQTYAPSKSPTRQPTKDGFTTPAPTAHPTYGVAPFTDHGDYTSTCSFLHCTKDSSGGVVIHHADRESSESGKRHVCAHDLHVEGKCGCECYDESVGVWEEILSPKARSYVRMSSASSCPVNMYGACWYLGKLGDTCSLTCAQRHRAYVHGKYAPDHDPITPHILQREPTLKHMAWAVHECYHPGDPLSPTDRYMPADPNGLGSTTSTSADPNLRRRLTDDGTCGGLNEEPCANDVNNGCMPYKNGNAALVLDENLLVCVRCGYTGEKVCTHHFTANNGCAAGYGPILGDGKCYAKPTNAPTKAPTPPFDDEFFMPTEDEAHSDLIDRIGHGLGEHFSAPMCQLVCPCALDPNEIPEPPVEGADDPGYPEQ